MLPNLMSSPVLPGCRQWIVHCGNYNYARTRDCFTKYTRIQPVSCGGYSVSGYGTVELDVLKSPGGETTHIVLNNVVHIPYMDCNGFSCLAGPGVVGTDAQPSEIYGLDASENKIWYAKFTPGESPIGSLGTLQLANQPAQHPGSTCHLFLAFHLTVTHDELHALRQAKIRPG